MKKDSHLRSARASKLLGTDLSPDLKTGVIAARLKVGGTTPEESEWVKIISNNGANSVAQFTNNDDGKPSGPATEVGESSCIASIIIFFR